MFPRNANRNEGTFGCFPGAKTGTRVCSHEKPERGCVRQNHPFTKPHFCLLSKLRAGHLRGGQTTITNVQNRSILCFASFIVLWSLQAVPPVRLGLSGRNSGKTLETLSELFLKFHLRTRLGSPNPYSSKHLKPPKRFQNSLPLHTAGDASFSRSESKEDLSELVMEEFSAGLRVFLTLGARTPWKVGDF